MRPAAAARPEDAYSSARIQGPSSARAGRRGADADRAAGAYGLHERTEAASIRRSPRRAGVASDASSGTFATASGKVRGGASRPDARLLPPPPPPPGRRIGESSISASPSRGGGATHGHPRGESARRRRTFPAAAAEISARLGAF